MRTFVGKHPEFKEAYWKKFYDYKIRPKINRDF